MTLYYVRSTDGDNTSDGLSWANAKATVANAFATCAAGDTVYVSNAHSESYGAGNLILTSPGTSDAPCALLCVSDAAEPPTAMATTAVVATNTGRSLFLRNGYCYVYGITFNSDGKLYVSNGNGAGPDGWILDTCVLNVISGDDIDIGEDSYAHELYTELINTQVSVSADTCQILVRTDVVIRDCPDFFAAGSAIPTVLFDFGTTDNANIPKVVFRNVGLQDLNTALFAANTNISALFHLENCQLHANLTMVSGTPIFGGIECRFVNCDDGDTNYTYKLAKHPGTIDHETTIVVPAGASDGTTSFSRKMVTGAEPQFFHPLVSDPIVAYSNSAGVALTASVEVITDNVTLTDAEAWLEVEYVGTANTTLGTMTSDRAADILATPANQTTSNATWVTTGLSTPVTQVLSVSFTPQEKGPVRARVCLAKANTTMYYDPVLTIAAA